MTSISSFTSTIGNAAPDMLALMRPSMTGIDHAAHAPASSNVEPNALGGSYVQGATQTVSKLDENIARRTKALAGLDQTDPAGAKQEREQLDLLERLRTRIEESITRVSDIMSGRDPQAVADKDRMRQQLEELDQLDARRRQLAQQVTFNAPAAATPAPAQVAGAYAAAAGPR